MPFPPLNISNPKFHFREGIKELCTIELFPAILQVSNFLVIMLLELIAALVAGVIGVFMGKLPALPPGALNRMEAKVLDMPGRGLAACAVRSSPSLCV